MCLRLKDETVKSKIAEEDIICYKAVVLFFSLDKTKFKIWRFLYWSNKRYSCRRKNIN